MANILIRNLDDSAIAKWRIAAKKRGTSLQVVLKEAFEKTAPNAESKEEILRRIDELRAQTSSEKSNLALELIREGRDYLDAKVEKHFK